MVNIENPENTWKLHHIELRTTSEGKAYLIRGITHNFDSESVIYESDHPTPGEINVFLGKIEDKIAEGHKLSLEHGVPFVKDSISSEA